MNEPNFASKLRNKMKELRSQGEDESQESEVELQRRKIEADIEKKAAKKQKKGAYSFDDEPLFEFDSFVEEESLRQPAEGFVSVDDYLQNSDDSAAESLDLPAAEPISSATSKSPDINEVTLAKLTEFITRVEEMTSRIGASTQKSTDSTASEADIEQISSSLRAELNHFKGDTSGSAEPAEIPDTGAEEAVAEPAAETVAEAVVEAVDVVSENINFGVVKGFETVEIPDTGVEEAVAETVAEAVAEPVDVVGENINFGVVKGFETIEIPDTGAEEAEEVASETRAEVTITADDAEVEIAPFVDEPIVERVPFADEPIVENAPFAEEIVTENAPFTEKTVAENAPFADEVVDYNQEISGTIEERFTPIETINNTENTDTGAVRMVENTDTGAVETSENTDTGRYSEPKQVTFDDAMAETTHKPSENLSEQMSANQSVTIIGKSEITHAVAPKIAENVQKTAPATMQIYGQIGDTHDENIENNNLLTNALLDHDEEDDDELTPEKFVNKTYEQIRLQELSAEVLDSAIVLHGDIWDDHDREVWQHEENIIREIALINLPPLKTVLETPELPIEAGNVNVKTSYRYEGGERERLFRAPIDIEEVDENYEMARRSFFEQREKKRNAELRSKLSSSHKKVFYSLIFAVIVFVFENINLLLAGLPDRLLFHENALIFASAHLALMIVGAIISWEICFYAVKNAKNNCFTLEFMTLLTVAFSLIYHFSLVCFFTPSNPERMLLLGTPAAISIFLCYLFRYFKNKLIYRAFYTTSREGEYSTLLKLSHNSAIPEFVSYGRYISERASLFKQNTLRRVDAPYNSEPSVDTYGGKQKPLMISLAIASILFGIIIAFIEKKAYIAVYYAYLSFVLSAPISLYLIYTFSRLMASKNAFDEGAIITDFECETQIGEENIVMLNDTDIFPLENLEIIKYDVRRSPTLEKNLAHMAELFDHMGGTLSSIFKKMESQLPRQGSLKITEISEHGVSAKVDGSTIRAGSAEYLSSHGVTVEDTDFDYPQNVRVMYISDSEVFCARIVMSYKADRKICKKLSAFRTKGVVFSLKTCNPCIDSRLILATTALEPELLKVVKYNVHDEILPQRTDREGSLISRKGIFGLLAALKAYMCQKRQQKKSGALVFSMVAIGIALSVASYLFDAKFGFTSILTAVYQAMICAASALYVTFTK